MTLCNMATKLWAESSKYTTIVSKCAYQRCHYNVLIYNHGKWQDRWPMKIVMGLLTNNQVKGDYRSELQI